MAELGELKPKPEPGPETQPYWDGLKQGRLVLQTCGDCGQVRHYPRPLCARCYSFDVAWIEASGRGTIHSWAECHHPFNPGFKAETPYLLVTVDLAEGVRMQAPLRDAQPEELAIGQDVVVIYEPQSETLTLPAFRLA